MGFSLTFSAFHLACRCVSGAGYLILIDSKKLSKCSVVCTLSLWILSYLDVHFKWRSATIWIHISWQLSGLWPSYWTGHFVDKRQTLERSKDLSLEFSSEHNIT